MRWRTDASRAHHLQGITSLDFGKLHLQTRLSSFTGLADNEEVYPSSFVDLGQHAASHLSFRRKFSFVVPPNVAAHLKSSYAKVEFFAKCQPTFLERLTRWDDLRELLESSSSAGTPPAARTPPQEPMRRSETDFVQEETHDISARLQLLEINAAGEWAPVSVLSQDAADPGSFFIQQGLQRRLRLSLLHGSGKSLKWQSVSKITIGQIRPADKNSGHGGDLGGGNDVDLRLLPGKPSTDVDAPDNDDVVFHPDGTSTLAAEAPWDSSAHDSALLNRPSGSGQRVLLRLTFFVQIDTAEKPAVFTHDVSVKILARGASGPGSIFTGLWGSARVLQQTSTLFSLVLSPSPTRSAADLWRLDTSQSYVKGEEFLPHGWKIRGVSAVKDHLQLRRTERLAADVRAVEALVDACASSSSSASASPRLGSHEDVASADDLKRKVVDLWTARFGPRKEMNLSRQAQPPPSLLAKYIDVNPKFLPRVALARRSDIVARKKGFLNVLVDSPNNVWAKRFCVLRRPYFHLYETSSETDEVSIINLSSDPSTGSGDLTVVSSPEVAHLLGVSIQPSPPYFRPLEADDLSSSLPAAQTRLHRLHPVQLVRLPGDERQGRSRLAQHARTQLAAVDPRPSTYCPAHTHASSPAPHSHPSHLPLPPSTPLCPLLLCPPRTRRARHHAATPAALNFTTPRCHDHHAVCHARSVTGACTAPVDVRGRRTASTRREARRLAKGRRVAQQ